jgi:hypothetical protein
VVVLAVLYVKYYHVIGPRLLLMLAGLSAVRLLLKRLRGLLSPPGNTNAEETNRAVDAEYEIVDDDKTKPPTAA